MRSALSVVAVCAVAAAPVPVYLWSSSARAASGVQRRAHVDAAELSALVAEAAAGLGKTGTVNLFTFDDLHAEDVAPLTALAARQEGRGAMHLLAHALSTASYGVAVKAADVENAEVANLAALFADSCTVVRVAGRAGVADESEMSRETYQTRMAHPTEGCTVYAVPLLRADVDGEMSFAMQAAAAAAKAGPALGILTAQPDTSSARLLGATAAYALSTYGNSTGIYMNPPVMEGLLVSLILIFFLSIALYCVMGIQSPDLLFTQTMAMPAGKEY